MDVDRARLRERLNDLPKDAKVAAAAVLADYPPLSDDAYDGDPTRLAAVATALADRLATIGVTLRIPLRTDGYRERFLALPVDLADEVVLAARLVEAPNFEYADRWEPEHAAAVDALLTAATATAVARRAAVFAHLSDIGWDGEDVRHDICRQLSGGATQSTNGLTAPEVTGLAHWVAGAKAGRLSYVAGVGVVDGDTAEVQPAYTCDWRALAKTKGVTLTHLRKLAKGAADGLLLPVPGLGNDPTDRRVTAAVWRLLGTEEMMTNGAPDGKVSLSTAPASPSVPATVVAPPPAEKVAGAALTPPSGAAAANGHYGGGVLVLVPLERLEAVVAVLA